MFRLKRKNRFRAYIDRIDAVSVSGWVMDTLEPDRRIALQLRLGMRLIASERAELFRPDLRAAGIGDGCYGFRIALPRGFEPSDRHGLRLVDAATGAQLVGPERTPGTTQETPWDTLFDAEHYLRQIPEAERGAARRDAAAHFRERGWRLGLDPHPLFAVRYYLREAAETPKIDPVEHFLGEGRVRGLSPHPLCDVGQYRSARPDLDAARIHPLIHFLHFGEAEQTQLTPFFDAAFYRGQVRDPIPAGMPALVHYLKQGWRAGLRPHPDFDTALYRQRMGLAQTIEPLAHFQEQLRAARRDAAQAAPTVSVVLVNADRIVLTLLSLIALRRATPRADVEVVIVDSGSGADAFAALSCNAGDARVIRAGRDVGRGEGRNIGAEAARGETLVFLETGTLVEAGWLDPLEAALDAGAAAAGGGAVLALRADAFRRALGYDLGVDAASDDDDLRRRLAAPPPPAMPAAHTRTKRIALYSRYALTPGGGERYLLSLAAALRADHTAVLYTPDRVSAVRIASLSRALDLPCDHIETRPWTGRREIPDVFVCMSNDVLPSVPAFGRTNLFLCQFPFPMPPETQAEQWGNLAGYDAMLVYSRFAARHAAEAADALRLTLPPCHVLSPPVPQIAGAQESPDHEAADPDAPFRILNVGRFSPDGHCKRQDTMIAAFAEVAARSTRPVELHLAGALNTVARDRAYVEALRHAAEGLPVRFHLNAQSAQIHALYRAADAYWHMTGADDDVRATPERFEHFGITIGEAMSAGVIPIVLRHGGPAEIVTDGVDGFWVADGADLAARTLALAQGGVAEAAQMRAAARRRAAAFAFPAFEADLRAILAGLDAPRG